MGDVLSSDIQSEKICDILIETELNPRGHVGLSCPLLTLALRRSVRTTWYEAKTSSWFRPKVDETKTFMSLKV